MAEEAKRPKAVSMATIARKLDDMAQSMSLLQSRLELIEYRMADLQALALRQLNRQIIPLDEEFVATATPTGWMVIGREELRSVVHLSDGGNIHEPGTFAVLRRLIKPGDTVIDVGAHVGLLTVPFAQAVGPDGHIHAFEPMPRSAEALRRSLLLNGLSERCTIHLTAVADKVGQMHFYRGVNSMMGSLYRDKESASYSDVPVTTLDTAIGHGTRVHLVKIDAEGAEAAIAVGMTRLAYENPDLLVMAELGPSHLEKVGLTVNDWFDTFIRLGLTESYRIHEHGTGVSAFRATDIDHLYSANILFARTGNPRMKRLLDDGIDTDAGTILRGEDND